MKEREAIERSKKGAVTVKSLVKDLKNLGLTPGSTVLVHSSLSSLGWVCGGAVAVIFALEEVIRPYGTLVMPTHSGDLSDPEGWENPPVPKDWWPVIRKNMPAFDPELTPTSGMGKIPETFRNQRNVFRSSHPHFSFAAWGEKAMAVLDPHSLAYGLGENSPLARVYDLDGFILLLGTDHSTNTSLHLSEIRAEYPSKKQVFYFAPVTVDDHRRWKRFRDINYESDDFAELGKAFEKENPRDVRIGNVGYSKARLIPQRALVDYGVRWLSRWRKQTKGAVPKIAETP